MVQARCHHPPSSLMKKNRKYWQLKIRHVLNSNTWQTVSMVIFIVFASTALSIWLIWRSLYLPEIKNHASYLVSELNLIDHANQSFANNPAVLSWIVDNSHIQLIDDPKDFPVVNDKIVADFFTDIFAKEVSQELGRDVKVYFKFKPTPQLWVWDSKYPDRWLREPVIHYSQYSVGLLIGFVFGLPILTLLVSLILVRRLNRPLKKLESTANDYIHLGHATTLPEVGSNEIRKVNTAFNRLFNTLHQAQKERTIMLAGISHDLRTPLTRMRLTAEMLPDEFFREGLVYDIEDMDAILEQFMSFMKDGSDEAVRATNLEMIFHEISVQFNEVNFIYDNRVAEEVMVRPLSVKRLIVNLVNNAIRYGREPIYLGAVITTRPQDDIDLTAHTAPSVRRILTISVRDEGEGVAESELDRIMQPFERGETARTTQGSGLGLAIVNRIAHLHQGEVIAQNHDHGGLEVLVHLPLMEDAPSPRGDDN